MAARLVATLVMVALAAAVLPGNNTVTSLLPSSWVARFFFNDFLLAPLTVVRILNDVCVASSGRVGTCMSKNECVRKRGTGTGTCARGFGVCCVIVATENGVAYGNNTLIYKDKFNSAVDLTYTVLRMNDDICQYRLDVKRLHLSPAETDGSCKDWMKISQDTKFNKVCGFTRHVHYYIDVSSRSTVFTFHTEASKDYQRDWEIYVQQLTCDATGTAGPEALLTNP
ncbi:uncharacterized protein LOC121855855 [Homarus americanus]|uniref:uncharacterized protein LOC121855855 n=1 Tax=Homarus americanus TaxID=6706 RepID=UPI001C47A57E|nr:uncharacterized protein LOC121855855 [Homarus americanus]